MPENLESWLEIHFPGKYLVAENIIDINPIRLVDKKKKSIVADRNDPEVQMVVNWNKTQPDLGITIDDLQAKWEKGKKEVTAGRNLFKALKENGLDKVSAGVIEQAAYILIYEEPTAELRKAYLAKIMATVDALPDHNQTSIWIECMEPSAYKDQFKDIITLDYWNRGDSYHDHKKIMSVDFEWSPGLEVEIMNTKWSINSASDRCTQYRENAYQAALTWAEKNLQTPFYLDKDHMVGVGVDDIDPLALEFDFPYYASKPDTSVSGYDDNAVGFVNGIYQTEHKTFTKIKKTTER